MEHMMIPLTESSVLSSANAFKSPSKKEDTPHDQDGKLEQWKMDINSWTKEEEEEFEPLPINVYSFPSHGTNEDPPFSNDVSDNEHDREENNSYFFLNLLLFDTINNRTQILPLQIKLQKLKLLTDLKNITIIILLDMMVWCTVTPAIEKILIKVLIIRTLVGIT